LEFFSMRTPIRAAIRLAFVGFLGLAGFLTAASQAPAAALTLPKAAVAHISARFYPRFTRL